MGASAVAVGFLRCRSDERVSRGFVVVVCAILLVEAGVGLWGFLLHATGNLHGPSGMVQEFHLWSAPIAPLLFPNLMVLGMIGLWQLRGKAA